MLFFSPSRQVSEHSFATQRSHRWQSQQKPCPELGLGAYSPFVSAWEAWGRLRCHSLCSSCSWQWTRSSRAAKKKLGQYLVYRGLLDVASVLECHILWSKSFKPLEAQLPPVFPSFGPEIEIKKKKKSQECQTRPFAHKNLNGELSPEGSFRSCGALGVK